MPTITLDRKTVNGALPGPKGDAYFWDQTLRGFGLVVRKEADGAIRRSFVVQYRIGCKQRRQKIGDSAKINCDQARKRATELLAQVTLGQDPAAEKDAARAAAATALTFSKAVEQYLKVKERQLRPASFKNTTMYLTRPQYFGPLHRRPLNDIERADVASCLRDIEENSGNVSRGRTRAAVSALFTWAMQEGMAKQNPVIGTKGQGERTERDRFLTDEELRLVWNACGDDDFGKIVRLLILTGCRESEIGGLRWSEIRDGAIHLPPERVKNKRPHTLVLTETARQIIESVPVRVGRDHLFGWSGTGFGSWRHGKRALQDGIKEQWKLHDLRRSVATGMAEIGIEPHIIEAVLNHASGHKGGVAGIYNRASYSKQMSVALARWADHVVATVRGETSNVLTLRASVKVGHCWPDVVRSESMTSSLLGAASGRRSAMQKSTLRG